MAKVSVMIPSYNHERFVGEAIESVLNQTFQDFEIIISDDCSPDHTVDIIRSYHDPRIKLHVFQKNVGATRNHEYCWQHCTAPYIALLNSDDKWMPEHLEKAVQYLDTHPECGAAFSWTSCIDEEGNESNEFDYVFSQPNRTRAEWLRRFFTAGNCICHPSMVIRQEVYQKIGFYSRSLRQLPDFDEWIRLVKFYDIHVIQEKLVMHRRLNASMANTSSPTLHNSVRDVAESNYILSKFFDNVDEELFVEAFRPLFRNPKAKTHEEYVCEKYFVLLDQHYYLPSISPSHAFIYFNSIYSLPHIAETFEEKYGYTLKDFHQFGGALDYIGLLKNQEQFINPNTTKSRLGALAWALFGKNTPLYNKAKAVYWKLRKH